MANDRIVGGNCWIIMRMSWEFDVVKLRGEGCFQPTKILLTSFLNGNVWGCLIFCGWTT